MEPRRFRPRLIEVAVVVAGILVACYAVWVIRDVASSGPDVSSGATTRITESPSPSTSPSASSDAAAASLAPFRRAVSRAESILVIGDASGDRLDEWVDLWAGGFAEDATQPRQVSLHTWDTESQEFVTASVRGTGPLLDVWNLSFPGAAADYAQNLAQVPQKPDAILFSLGHDRGERSLARAVRATTAASTERWGELPTAYVLQNPATGPKAEQQAAAVEQMRGLASTNQVPVIDVNDAFREEADLADLLLDGALPNENGSRVWADAVTQALAR